MLKVAITGGVATGKSSVCHIFQELGAYVVIADHIVHNLYSQNSSYAKQVISLLGEEIITNSEIDRKKVAEIVFNSEEKLQKLEQLTHPLVRDEINKQYEKVKNAKKFSLFVVEFPLLFEIHDEKLYDYTVTVIADKAACQARFIDKGKTILDYEKRTARQMTLQEKAKKADFVIENNGTLGRLRVQVQALFNKLNQFHDQKEKDLLP